MTTVGRMAGVSQVTVSRALSDPDKVSPDTLRRIREAIEATGYVPNAVAGALASRRSRLITALVPSITNIVYSSLLHGFAEIMRQHGYQIMTSEIGFDPAREQETIIAHLSRRPDGILLTGIHHTPEARRMLIGSGIPVVEIWDISETPIDCCVGFSHAEVGRQVAEFAVGAGYAQAATVTAGDIRAQRRRDSFIDRYQALTGSKVTRIDYPAGTATLGQGRDALAALIDRQGFAAGVVFCSSDQFAHGILTEATTRGLDVPGRIAVIGFGDQVFAARTHPAMTTIRVDRDALGKEAANALLQRFRDDAVGPASIDVGFSLIRRESA
ncbi:LacI family transcriptional regulator, gluconate utilization system Gnt-I transcriptional repressor [Paracoccus isoporae]|uniref:LacI family transcriptional regulator, gluconate utilization system Gnt-I transcriptional repressor n=2 Tax=Paracoccus isoporae TaxID=591205 RepID=A0A1G7DD98_9RHOB|nr:LacI family transcriptional regulator, gluconate utilization system Gnt-I transcriptional repressor [Paracoccus isoporae]